MSAVYQLRAYTPAGVLTNIITDFINLAYVREVNGPGMCQFTLNADHLAIDDLELDAQVGCGAPTLPTVSTGTAISTASGAVSRGAPTATALLLTLPIVLGR